jgi:VCBS repeat-containing protein
VTAPGGNLEAGLFFMARSRSSYIGSSLQRFAKLFRRRQAARGSSSALRSSPFARPRRLGTAFEPLEPRAMLDGSPSFAAIADQTVLGGAPTWLGITGTPGASGDPLTYSVSVSNPSLLQATVPTGNKSLQMNVDGFGQMTFELFDNLVPDVTSHIESLVNSGDFNNSSSLPVNFYRISHEGDGSDFVIQGGPQFPSGASPLGQFDDEFNPDLQFTTSGLLAMAKSTDDTNDSQIFVTGAPTRFLDFQHSIFGVITAGDSVRQAIQHSTSSGDGPPPSTISIGSSQIITDTTNAALELKAARGASGTSDVTVTVTDTVTGQTSQQTFHVTVTPDTQSPAPYLNKIAPVSGTPGHPITVQLSATDVTGGADVFDAVKPASETTNYTVNVDHNTGLVTLTPPADFTGTFHVTMSVKGATTRTTADQSDTQDVAVTVAAPVLGANNDTTSVAENASATTINVLSNDTGNGLTITAVGTPTAGGTAAISSDSQSILYTPAANFQGQDTFTYTAKDSTGATQTATATVNVTATTTNTATTGTLSGFVYFDVNNNGVFDNGELAIGDVTVTLTGTKTSDSSAVNLTTKTASDGSYSFSTLDPGSYKLKETQPAFVIDGKDTIGSQGGTVGSDQFTITLTADTAGTNNNFGELGRDITTISIKDFFASNSQNDGIAAFDTSGTELWHTLDSGVWQGFSGETFSTTASALNVSATNSAAQPVTASVSTSSPSVELISQAGGNSLYRLTATPTTLDFTSSTSNGTSPSGNASTNSTPTANNDTYSTAFNTPLTIAASGVLSNDTDPNNKSLTAAVSTQPANGTLTLNSNGSFTYTPTTGFSGSDSFTYTATNGTQTSSAATVSITVAASSNAPTVTSHTYSTNEGTPLTVSAASGVLSGAADPQSLSMTAAAVTQPAHGTLALAADGSFVYTPAAAFSGNDSFTYTASDSSATSQPATVTITVAATTTPTANADNFSVTEDTPLTIAAASGVLANDTDPNSSTLTAAVVAQPSHGTLSLNSDGSFTYTPETSFTGSDSFTYTATNTSSQSATATVTLTVHAPNHAPVAVADSYTANENTPFSPASAAGVLANDTDADSQTLTAQIANQPQHGTVSLNSDGTFTYTPATNFSGTDTFTYQASDGTALSDVTTVTLTVNHVNQPPTANADSFAVATNGTLDIPASQGVLANDTDPDNDSLTAVQMSEAANGTVSVAPDGSFTYVPNTDFSGDDTFTYKAHDGSLDSNVVTVTITVGPTSNVAPLAIDDSYTATGASLTVDTASGVLNNDTDANGDTITAQLVIAPNNGSVTLNPDGSFSYTANAGFTGDDSFEYQASDGQANSNLAKVKITVNGAEGEAASGLAMAHDAALLSLLGDDGMLS